MTSTFRRTLLIASGLAMTVFSFAQKSEVPKGWHLLDAQKDGYYGISLQQAYDFVKSKKLKSQPVVVAVIDSGIDTLHEDLKPVLWRNPGEIPGNGIDDDKNGYIDDVYGWNFLGNSKGENVEKDSYEATRVYHKLRNKWGNTTVAQDSLSPDEAKEYEMFWRAKSDVVGLQTSEEEMQKLKETYEQIKMVEKIIQAGDVAIRKQLGKEEYTCKDLAEFSSDNDTAMHVAKIMTSICRDNDTDEISNLLLLDDIEGELGQMENELNKQEAAEKAPRNYRGEIVGDNYFDLNDRYYGNNNVMVSKKSAMHGTHVSGIIAAARNNDLGMDGVADNVRIMSIRAVPDGDEHDKDIALAIRYAVDNGAKIINMSFGKGFSPEKKWVDDAVRYAQTKGVLLVHAAGNSARNIDTSWNFPTPLFTDKTRASNWITVGASGDPKAGGITAGFSNYGKTEVDVFAPGVQIYSTVPGGNTYMNLQGTSMASPVVAGLAAFVLSHYPDLTPEQLKTIIEKSAKSPDMKVKEPGTGEDVDLKDISKTGGLVNAYEAIKLAAEMKQDKPGKSKVKEKRN